MIGVIGYTAPVPSTTYCQAYDPGPQQRHITSTPGSAKWVRRSSSGRSTPPSISRPVSS